MRMMPVRGKERGQEEERGSWGYPGGGGVLCVDQSKFIIMVWLLFET